ncbi:MAG: Protein GrpE [Microgenomates group bacterium GW2011_GWC1_43_13]|uniref:Protein GrpE n=2 Tax=Candidatus Woeseibacteriota TaxID=1752722 RepID=A0A837IG40_9BACT|nr:MAG: Protein GrpE [Microgenomates group bacterium GW2011_GWC1_43_13]KKT33501.1 MAG: Protein GrpE [Candidatus Woesebacteria bacterium GW2011_GWB1_44_11]KKT54990.1 MAG: Protein GrpE [Candidatus Woesebacteria bacterium GW2011_GWA1_44_23]OGM83305.1 MAG: nucleotide exchange factor GrpE [Candidatus Woesebacteria bacterium RIFOXYB1_FULL_42_36]
MDNKKTKKTASSDAQKIKIKNVDRAHEELETVKAMLARALADYDNLSKRIDRERADSGKIASVGIIIRLLPVLDNLESAQEHLQDQGLAISLDEFKKILSEEGFSEIRPREGDIFAPEVMEAIEVVKGESDNKISEVVLVGWKFEDGMVVRHAKVKVSKK